MKEDELLERITMDSDIFGRKPIVRGRRLAVEHVLGILAAGDDIGTILECYPWLERDDVLACLACTSVSWKGEPASSSVTLTFPRRRSDSACPDLCRETSPILVQADS